MFGFVGWFWVSMWESVAGSWRWFGAEKAALTLTKELIADCNSWISVFAIVMVRIFSGIGVIGIRFHIWRSSSLLMVSVYVMKVLHPEWMHECHHNRVCFLIFPFYRFYQLCQFFMKLSFVKIWCFEMCLEFLMVFW